MACLHDAIRDLGRSQAELAELLGSRSRASEVLHRKRGLTLEHIRLIAEAWHLPMALPAKPYALAQDAARPPGVLYHPPTGARPPLALRGFPAWSMPPLDRR